MALPANLVNRIDSGWFPFFIREHPEHPEYGDFTAQFGPGTIHPFGVSDPNILSFLFWRVKKFAVHLAFSGSAVASGTCVDIHPPHSNIPWSYRLTASGSYDGILDMSTSDATWADAEDDRVPVTNPLQLIGLEDDVPYHEFKKPSLFEPSLEVGSANYSWITEANCQSLPESTYFLDKLSMSLFSGNYTQAFADRIVKYSGLYYPQIFFEFYPNVTSSIHSAWLGDTSPGVRDAGSIDVKDIGGSVIGSVPLKGNITFGGETEDDIQINGHIQVDTLW